MARGFVATLKKLIEMRTEHIGINWINTPEYLLKNNSKLISELRELLASKGYRRLQESNSPQEDFYLIKED